VIAWIALVLTRAERAVVRQVSFPVGTSILCLAVKVRVVTEVARGENAEPVAKHERQRYGTGPCMASLPS